MIENSYEDAPRLPDTDGIELGHLVAGGGPVELEIGPGRGGFIFERLRADPDVAVVGLEIRRKWASIVDSRLKLQGLGHRGRVYAEDVRLALPRLAAASIRNVFVHFPDPWWKKRHAKRRVLSASVLSELARVLQPAGELFVQTDVSERAEEYERALAIQPEFAAFGEVGPRLSHNPYGARSPRERRAVEDGLPVVRLRFRRL